MAYTPAKQTYCINSLINIKKKDDVITKQKIY